MYPLFASPELAGLPMTSLESGTPFAAIWKSELPALDEEEDVSKPAQVVYSVVPSIEWEPDNVSIPCRRRGQ